MFFRAEESFSSSESEEDDDAVEGWSSYRIDQQFSRKLADNHCTVTETLKRWGVFSFWKSICLEDEIFGDASFFLWGGALAVSFRADIFCNDRSGMNIIGTETFTDVPQTRVQDSCICWSQAQPFISTTHTFAAKNMMCVSWNLSIFF